MKTIAITTLAALALGAFALAQMRKLQWKAASSVSVTSNTKDGKGKAAWSSSMLTGKENARNSAAGRR